MVEKFNILSAGGSSKGLNIFKSTAYKEHEAGPMAQMFWIFRWNASMWLICAVAFTLAFVLEHMWRYGWSPATAHWAGLFFRDALHSGGMSVIAAVPGWFARALVRPDFPAIVPLLPIIVFYFVSDDTLTKEFNPHGSDIYDSKSSRKATADDIKKMGQDWKNKEGLFNGFMMVLGYFKDGKKTKPLMLDETLSALCVAPPGAGKTAGVVVPTIVDCDNVSMIINDPKPELKQKTSAYRATIGPVFIMNWAGQDDPERGIFYPSWNPLSPEHVPFETEQRDLYIDTICKVLVPDATGTSADPHWSISGRAGLSGFLQYIVSKIERAKADDYFYGRLQSGEFNQEDADVLLEYYLSMSSNPNAYAAMGLLQRGELNTMNYVHVGTWRNIPDAWIGHEASLSMILDWLNAAQLANAAEMEERRKQGDQTVAFADPMKDVLDDAVNEAVEFAYAHRSVLELTQLANTPDKERGSILSTIMAGLGVFRNAAVRNRTSHSDFHFEDLRGLRDPRDGKIKPVSVYLSINMVDAQALNPITGIFIELMSNYLLVNTPDAISSNGKQLGPYPVLFVLDEMPKMQKLDAVIQGPDLGRGQKISYLIIGQDLHQIQEKYGADAAATIISTTAAKIVMRQNDPETADRFSKMIGDEIKKEKKKDKDGKETEETKAPKPLYSPMDILTLGEGKQIIIYQGWYHRPIEATQERYFLGKTDIQKKLQEKVKMGESAPMPEFLVPSHCRAMGYTGQIRFMDPETKTIKVLSE
ncbi:MAG: type IV secretory system conjugative DNA transfer family protein [Alphaproteobacteria bacterium]|nr:type IV secretory system conjugative DNA transfer family protein [Alphaproteobacteria bacterium]